MRNEKLTKCRYFDGEQMLLEQRMFEDFSVVIGLIETIVADKVITIVVLVVVFLCSFFVVLDKEALLACNTKVDCGCVLFSQQRNGVPGKCGVVFCSSGTLFSFFFSSSSSCCLQEVVDTESLGTLFRGSSAASRLISAFVSVVGQALLKSCLSNALGDLVMADSERLIDKESLDTQQSVRKKKKNQMVLFLMVFLDRREEALTAQGQRSKRCLLNLSLNKPRCSCCQ
jgi:hypothetical protein